MRRKIKKTLFFSVILVLVLTSTVFAYSLFAEDIGYTPVDENWDVDNTKDAIDSLRKYVTRRGTLVKTITSSSTSYTIENDGYIIGRIRAGYPSAAAMIFFNSTNNDNFNYAVACAQYNLDNYFPVSLYATKGTLVYTRNS